MMRRKLSALVVILLFTVACHPPITIVTPEGKIAYTADQFAKRVLEFQNVIIQAEMTGGLPIGTARVLIKATVDVSLVLHDTPSGWKGTIKTIWMVAKSDIPPISNPTVLAAFTSIDVIFSAL